MKAWRLRDFGDHRLVEVPIPELEDRDVLIKVKVVQASVTDTEVLKGKAVALTSSSIGKRLAEGKPVQRGHEYCGEVVETGKGVTLLHIGDRVASPAAVYCGSCRMCLLGRHSECLSPRHLGGDILGAFAEYLSLPEWAAVRIPDGPTDNEVAALQPLSSCIGSVRSAGIEMGDAVVVLGQGAMGLGILQVAKLAGAGRLIAVARRTENLDLSKKYGASSMINAKQTNVVEEVRRLTESSGADVVFDAAGGSTEHGLSGLETIRQAFKMVRPGGKVIQSAVLTGSLELDTVFMKRNKINYINPLTGTSKFLELAAFWVARGRVQVGPQITHVLHGLEKLPEAIEITENKAKYSATNPAQVVL
ncbi:MAG: alcohol dehydrogenase catalytic domain-containing protein [Chloroflexi bacterium]|nr:alcohol dehydrogenase catalytic domain-containing protein [Chloroflexota bacterium]